MDFNLKEHFPEGIQISASSPEIQAVANKIYEESVDFFNKHNSVGNNCHHSLLKVSL